MKQEDSIVYPSIPNSAPIAKSELLKELNVESVEELYADIPSEIRLNRDLNLPDPIFSEYLLRKHVEEIFSKNITCQENLSFLGGGCWQHYVPAICDEINQRGEFLTAYEAENYQDHGKYQALFEYASMMGDLLEMDMVNLPTFDWMQAAATSARMASRITGRFEVLVAKSICPQRLNKIINYCKPDIKVRQLDFDSETGEVDLNTIKRNISPETAAIYFENPSYFGAIETHGTEISDIAHEEGALCIVGVDPISLGIMTPPVEYGADIVCGDIQPLGMHMQYGGGQAGFIATPDEERFVMEFPSRLFGMVNTSEPGEYGFGDAAFDRLSWAVREEGKEFVGTSTALWGITAGVYLSLMGPQGMREIGESIMFRSQYAISKLSTLKGVRCPVFKRPHFKEFIVNFDASSKSVSEINEQLLKKGLFGGLDLSENFPELGNSALFCVTEIHAKEDIDRLILSLEEVLQ
jgi:glycine dehydrogenase subunit 1